MMSLRYLCGKSNLWKRFLLSEVTSSHATANLRRFSGVVYNRKEYFCTCRKIDNSWAKRYQILNEYKRLYCNSLLDGDITQLRENQHEKELKKLSQLFPQPRVTLNELTSKTPQKIFDIHYKQNLLAPKGNRKKVAQGDWICTYAFIWPEQIKFESTALSKRQAAEQSATQALHWLYKNKSIDSKGNPIYDSQVVDKLRSNINEPIEVTISEKSTERIEKIWNDYEKEIRPLYEATFNKAAQNAIYTPVLVKDSTLDEDEFSEDELQIEEPADALEAKPHIHPVYGKPMQAPSAAALERRNKALERTFQKYDEALTPLPIDEYADKITSTLSTSRVAIIVGAAGCGKSTRAPAAILRACGANTAAIVSEPRRVAAIGLAQRVANELGEEVGESIGHQVRLNSKPPRPLGGSILYCTSGVLLKRLQSNPGLIGCSHVIIDEAHERDVNTDISLLLLKRALDINPNLKVVVMSATLDIKVFTRYFDSCPVMEVPGRIFPVEVSYLEDLQKKYGLQLKNMAENCKKEDGRPFISCREIAEVIKAVDSREVEGAILVFLPGWSDIRATKQLLDDHYGESGLHMILPVHSRLSTSDQTKMFTKPLPGIRKIVLATNIAETSITIPDVVHVIDTGAHKENTMREGTGTSSLETVWISQAAAKQRTGRAGRVQPGHCYRLYTKEKESHFVDHPSPEILRTPLDQTVLDCKAYAPDDKIEDFLSQLPEPPSKKAINFAVNDLIDLGALTPSQHLTRLGSLISSFSLRPRMCCSLLHAACAGVVSPVASIACQENGALFQRDCDQTQEIRDFKRKFNETSDHTALYWIQREFESVLEEKGRKGAQEWCGRHGLRKDGLHYVISLTNLHLEHLIKSSFMGPDPDPEELTRFSDIDELTVAILLSGSNSLLTTWKHVKTKGKLATVVDVFTSKGDRAHIGSESVNHGIAKRSDKTNLAVYFGGLHSLERRALVVYNTSLVPPHTVLLFSKGNIHSEIKSENDSITTTLRIPRHNLEVQIPTSQANLIMKTREMLWNTFQYHIDRDMKSIDYEEFTNVARFKVRLFKTICRILVEGHREYVEGTTKDIDVDR